MSFSVIVPTKGRDTLNRALASVTGQLADGDELLVLKDTCSFGNRLRDDAISRAAGTHLLFLDDDDVYTEDAFDHFRAAAADQPDRVHVFRMRRGPEVFWASPSIGPGNVGTPMFLVPNQPGKVGRFQNHHEPALTDFGFIEDTIRLRGDEPVFHEQIVALVRP